MSGLVSQQTRRHKNTFQLHMQDKSVYLLGAETEAEMDSWVMTLKKVIQSNDTTSLSDRNVSLRERGG